MQSAPSKSNPTPSPTESSEEELEDHSESSSLHFIPHSNRSSSFSNNSESSPVRSRTPSADPPRRPDKTASAWYELDLAIVIAFISPVANWLTGADHIKNVLLLLLLLFYLHQIIEVPWRLYNQARARRIHPLYTPSPSSSPSAMSSLHRLEHVYFTFTLLSPILGALLLKSFASYIAGSADVISWFSTGLFVLATAIRPWKHLIARCEARTEELHTQVHYPPDTQQQQSQGGRREEDADQIYERLKELEKTLVKRIQELEVRVKEVGSSVEGVEEDADEALAAVEKSVKKHTKKITTLEEKVDGLVNAPPPPIQTRCNHRCSNSRPFSLAHFFGWETMIDEPMSPRALHSPNHHLKRFPSTAARTLETIPEDGGALSYIQSVATKEDESLGVRMVVTAPLRLVRYLSAAPFKILGAVVGQLLGGPSRK